MKYLVIEEKRINPNMALRIVRKCCKDVRYPRTNRGKLQFFFPQSELTRENVDEIARELEMQVISLSNVRAIIGYY